MPRSGPRGRAGRKASALSPPRPALLALWKADRSDAQTWATATVTNASFHATRNALVPSRLSPFPKEKTASAPNGTDESVFSPREEGGRGRWGNKTRPRPLSERDESRTKENALPPPLRKAGAKRRGTPPSGGAKTPLAPPFASPSSVASEGQRAKRKRLCAPLQFLTVSRPFGRRSIARPLRTLCGGPRGRQA